MKIWRTTEIEELLQAARVTIESGEFDDNSMEVLGCLVEATQGILSHEVEAY